MTEIEQLREEITKLRERVAVLESGRSSSGVPVIDWTKPVQVGSPHFIPAGLPLPLGTITCSTPTKGQP